MWRAFLITQLLKGMEMKEKHAILTMAVRRLFHAVTADDILREENGQWFFQSKAIPDAEMAQLKESASYFLDSKLWKILKADSDYQANKRMFNDSKDVYDMIAGKFILWTADVWKTRLNNMKAITKLPTA